jgi:trimeric autotransporter adhesin
MKTQIHQSFIVLALIAGPHQVSAQYWEITGNSGTTPEMNFLGTTDNQALELRVNGLRALLLQPALGDTSAPNLIGGGHDNHVGSGSGLFIGGGQNNRIGSDADNCVIVGGNGNEIHGPTATSSMIGGGAQNALLSGAQISFIGGGADNQIGTNASYCAIVAGSANHVRRDAFASFIGGGYGNRIGINANMATIAGGFSNVCSASTATVGGGANNTASGEDAVVPGGAGNTASGITSFAGGSFANAKHDGAFVWADFQPPTADFQPRTFSSVTSNQFAVRCTGGAKFVTAIDSTGAQTAGVRLQAGDTAWSSISDRNAKKNLQTVDALAVLNKLSTIPVTQWNYKWESDTNTPHLGPMAQDFKAAFYPGRDDKSISTLEFDGVELAAIQGLNQELEEQRAEWKQKQTEITELKQKNESLEKRLEALEKIIRNQRSN